MEQGHPRLMAVPASCVETQFAPCASPSPWPLAPCCPPLAVRTQHRQTQGRTIDCAMPLFSMRGTRVSKPQSTAALPYLQRSRSRKHVRTVGVADLRCVPCRCLYKVALQRAATAPHPSPCAPGVMVLTVMNGSRASGS
jgi:hypothetical protein